MNNHPLNLAVRFLLEIAMVIVFAYWAWNRFEGMGRYLMCVILPLLGVILWAVFKVDGDPGKAIIAVPGWTRLMIEAALFVSAFFMLRSLGLHKWALVFAVVTLAHYLVSYDRILCLLKR